MKYFKIAGLILACFLLASGPLPASATPRLFQTSDYSHTFDFTQSNDSLWTTPPFDEEDIGYSTPKWGTYNLGSGWSTSYNKQSVYSANTLYMVYDLGASYTVSSLSATYDISLGIAAFECQLHAFVGVLDADLNVVSYSQHSYCPGDPAEHNTVSWTGTATARYLLVWCRPGSSVTEDAPGGSCLVSSASATVNGATNPFGQTGGGGSGPFRPVSRPDTVSVDNTLITTAPNANVHAFIGGQLVEVKNEGGVWTASVQDSAGRVAVYSRLQSINGVGGDTVSAGCVLGRAAPSTVDTTKGRIAFNSNLSPNGEWEDWPDSPDNTPCDANKYQSINCLDLDPNFTDPSKNWNATGPVTFSDGMALLGPGGSIYQDVNLDSGSTYIATLYVASFETDRSGDLTVTFGDATLNLPFFSHQPGSYERVESSATSPGAADYSPDLYRFKITNVPNMATMTTVRMRFACIGTTSPTAAPGDCYFSDPSLRTDQWSYDSEHVTYTPPSTGFTASTGASSGVYKIEDSYAIWRAVDISAFVDHATNYTITLRATAPLTGHLTGPYGKLHLFIRDHDTLDTLLDIGNVTIPSLFISGDLTLPFTLTTGTHIAGDLVIENLSDDLFSDSGWDVSINHVCMAVEGGTWPGYETADTGGDLLTQQCQATTTPAASPEIGTVTDFQTFGNWVSSGLQWLGSWLAYGFDLVRYLIMCILFGIINGIWQTLVNAASGLALLGSWLGLVVSAVAAWVIDGMRFAFNNLQAAIIPLANLIIGWLLSLPFVQSLIDAIGLAGIWLAGLWEAILSALSLFATGIRFFSTLATMITTFYAMLINAINGASSTVIAFPDCSNPADELYDLCIGFDTLNFVFQQIPTFAIFCMLCGMSLAWTQIKGAIDEFEGALSML